jgi:hypothetical protein
MSVYLIATIEVKGSGFAAFSGAIGEMIPILESVGWRLASAYSLRTGQLGTVIDIWELDDFNHMNVGMAAIAQSPRFPQIQAVLQDTILKETLCLADKLTYPKPG